LRASPVGHPRKSNSGLSPKVALDPLLGVGMPSRVGCCGASTASRLDQIFDRFLLRELGVSTRLRHRCRSSSRNCQVTAARVVSRLLGSATRTVVEPPDLGHPPLRKLWPERLLLKTSLSKSNSFTRNLRLRQYLSAAAEYSSPNTSQPRSRNASISAPVPQPTSMTFASTRVEDLGARTSS
jgi:hypothetical protein